MPSAVKEKRQQAAVLVLVEIKALLDELHGKTPPKGLFGKVENYALGNWKRLVPYVEADHLQMADNLIENAVRPFALERKKWLIAGHPNGGNAAATCLPKMSES